VGFLKQLLLGNGFDCVAGLESATGDYGAYGRGVVNVSCLDDADGGGEAANDLAGGGVLDLLCDADNLKLVADIDAGFLADVEHDLPAIDGGDESVNGDDVGGDAGGVGDEFGGELVDGLLDGFSDDGLLEVAGAEVSVAAAKAVPVASAAEQGGGGAGRGACAVGHAENLAGVDVDDSGADADVGVGLGVSDATDAESAPVAATSAEVGVLGFIAKLGDTADDDGVDAEQLANFGGAVGIGAVGVGEVLLGHDFVQRLAFDDGVGAVFDEVVDEQVGDALAHVDVAAEHGRGIGLHRSIVEIENGDAGFVSLGAGRRLRETRGESEGDKDGNENPVVAHESPQREKREQETGFTVRGALSRQILAN